LPTHKNFNIYKYQMSGTGRKLDRRNEVGEEPVAKSRRTENVNTTSNTPINNNNHINQNLVNVIFNCLI